MDVYVQKKVESYGESKGEAAVKCKGRTDATCCNYSLSSHFVLFKLHSVCAQSTSAEMKGVFLSVLILQSYML